MRSFTLAVLLTACELPPKPPPAEPVPPAAPAATPSRASIDAGQPADDEAPVADVSNSTEPRNWFPAHGATSVDEYDNSYGCDEIAVGPARAAALLCIDVVSASQYRVATHQIVRLVRGGKIVSVLDVQTRLEPLDGPVAPLGERTPGIVDLKLNIAADGLSAKVAPLDPQRDCTPGALGPVTEDPDAKDRDPELRAELREWAELDHQLVTQICNQRGKYVWDGRRFARGR